jgi:hypothetical protein
VKPTKFQITGVKTTKSNYTKKDVFAVFFKGDDGRSYRTWLDPNNGNYKRWQGVMKVGNVLTGINLKGNGNLIDADSFPRLVAEESGATAG